MTLRLCLQPRTTTVLRRELRPQLTPFFTRFRPCTIFSSTFGCCMSSKFSASPSPQSTEPKTKRRKLDIAEPRKIYPLNAMGPELKSNPTSLELTEVETTLRKLLLDVAAFIDQTPVPLAASDSEAAIPDELAKEPIVLRFTGGWVRDKLLGVESQDIDVAINKMTGYQFGLKMKEYLEVPGNPEKYGMVTPEEGPENAKSNGNRNGKGRKVAPGLYKIEANPEKSKHLETVTTNIMGLDIDLVNLRKETYTEDSRNPQMEFGTPEEDALRRDATVNAMFYNINTCEIEDFTGRGFKDMELNIIRTPLEPYQTFKDDPLRVLRLIRFASRLDYKIDPEAEKAMAHEEIREALRIKISRERVGIEIEKMLKGPDPHYALSLVDRLGLYETVFTNPHTPIHHKPDLEYFPRAYDFVQGLLDGSQGSTSHPNNAILVSMLTPEAEGRFFAWVYAALMPWAEAPTPPSTKSKPHYAAQLVAREGIKAPNKITEVVWAALRYAEDIKQVKDQCSKRIKYPHQKGTTEEAAASDTLGMAIRRWGPTWRQQVLFSLIHEICQQNVSRETVLESYVVFLSRLTELDLLEACTFKPLLTGTELAKALGCKPGPWMKDALDVVMAWQLRNPDSKDPAGAISAVQSSKEDGGSDGKGASAPKDSKKCELPTCLATHFLHNVIRPRFSSSSQNFTHPDVTAAGHKASAPSDQRKSRLLDEDPAAEWKDSKHGYVIELLRWTLSALDEKGVETNWGLLIPPILKMMDDIDTKWKAVSCELLTVLLKKTPPSLLARTGLGNVFEESLMPLFTYLPTLTPEPEAAELVDKAFPALMVLGKRLYPISNNNDNNQFQTSSSKTATSKSDPIDLFAMNSTKFLSTLLRRGILAPLFHCSPNSYPHLATTLLTHLPSLLNAMELDSVVHLQALVPLLSSILAEPLGVAYPPLLLAACNSLRILILNAWPRVKSYRVEVVRGVAVCWIRSDEQKEQVLHEGDERGKEIHRVRYELRNVIEVLDAVMNADGEEGFGAVWDGEKRVLVDADERLEGLFEGWGWDDGVGE